MARTKGKRNSDYDQVRRELIDKVRWRLAEENATGASLRELALAAGVTIPTIRHYFGTRDALVEAVMRDNLELGRETIAVLNLAPEDFAVSVKEAVQHIADGFRYGRVGEIVSIGLIEGLRNRKIGPFCIDSVLEPALQALQARFEKHVASGQMRACNARHAAIGLFAPIVLAFLHQHELSGAKEFPLQLDSFLNDHVEGFVRAYRAEKKAASRRREQSGEL